MQDTVLCTNKRVQHCTSCNILLAAIFPTFIVLGNVYLVEKHILKHGLEHENIQQEHILFRRIMFRAPYNRFRNSVVHFEEKSNQ